MKTVFRRLALLSLAIVALASVSSRRSFAQGSDELARRQYESGLSFSQNGRYAEALKDFQVVVDSFPQSSVADDALLQIALYHLETARDLPAAQAAVDKLLKDYPSSDSTPMGYVVVGRLTVAKGRAPADVDAALASFDRVPRLFPTSPAVAAARFFAGDTLRIARRTDEALDRFRRVTLEFPRSVWAARAEIAAASSLVAADRAVQALPRLQRIRLLFPNTLEASTALNYNSILYRLYVKKPAGYGFSGRYVGSQTDKFRDVVGVAVDDAGRILLGHKLGISVFDPKGTFMRIVSSTDPSAFFIEGPNRIVSVRRDQFVPEGAPGTPIGVPVPGKLPREVEEIPAVVTLTNGDRIVVDRQGKGVIRVSPLGKFLGNFAANFNAGRIARNTLDDVAMIDRDGRGIVIADRDGRVTSRIAQKGTGYAFENPLDVGFDPLGHLYVLDSKQAIFVFGPRNRLIATFSSVGSRDAGALQRPKAFAVDAAGRAYVFDEAAQRIQVYQ